MRPQSAGDAPRPGVSENFRREQHPPLSDVAVSQALHSCDISDIEVQQVALPVTTATHSKTKVPPRPVTALSSDPMRLAPGGSPEVTPRRLAALQREVKGLTSRPNGRHNKVSAPVLAETDQPSNHDAPREQGQDSPLTQSADIDSPRASETSIHEANQTDNKPEISCADVAENETEIEEKRDIVNEESRDTVDTSATILGNVDDNRTKDCRASGMKKQWLETQRMEDISARLIAAERENRSLSATVQMVRPQICVLSINLSLKQVCSQLENRCSAKEGLSIEEETRDRLLALDIERQHLEETTSGLRALMNSVESSWSTKLEQLKPLTEQDQPKNCSALIEAQLNESAERESKAIQQLATVVQTLESQQEEYEDLCNKNSCLQTALQEAREENQQLKADMQAQIEMSEQKCRQQYQNIEQELRRKVDELQSELKCARAEAHSAQDDAAQKIEAANREMERSMQSQEQLSAVTVHRLQESVVRLEQELSAANASASTAVKQCAELQAQNVNLGEKLASTTAKMETLRLDIADKASIIASLRESVQSTREDLKEKMQQDVPTKCSNSLIGVHGKQIEELQTTVSGLTQLVDAGAQNADELQQHVAVLQKTIVQWKTDATAERQSTAKKIDAITKLCTQSVDGERQSRKGGNNALPVLQPTSSSSPFVVLDSLQEDKVPSKSLHGKNNVQCDKAHKRQTSMRSALQQLRHELNKVHVQATDKQPVSMLVSSAVGPTPGVRNRTSARPLKTRSTAILGVR